MKKLLPSFLPNLDESVTDPIISSTDTYVFYYERDPTSNEPDVIAPPFPENSVILWKNTADTSSTNNLFMLKNRNNDDTPLIWSQYVDSDNITSFLPAKVFNYVTREFDTAFQISGSQDTHVSYAIDIATSGTVFLEIADDTNFTTNPQEVTRFSNGNTGNITGNLSGFIPAGKWVRLRTENNTETPTFTSGQETLF